MYAVSHTLGNQEQGQTGSTQGEPWQPQLSLFYWRGSSGGPRAAPVEHTLLSILSLDSCSLIYICLTKEDMYAGRGHGSPCRGCPADKAVVLTPPLCREDMYRGVDKLSPEERRALACIVVASNNKKVSGTENGGAGARDGRGAHER